MRTLLALLALLLATSAQAQQRQPANVSTLPTTTPQEFDLLDNQGRWMPLSAAANGVDPRSFGAKCDGSTNDDAALHAWAAAITADSAVFIPGVCVFKSTITFPVVNRVTIDGPGTLLYTGAGTTNDGVVIGQANASAGCAVYGWTVKRLRVMSNTVMTGGDGLHVMDSCTTNWTNVTVGDGLGGNQNWFNAVHFDGGNTLPWLNWAFSSHNKALTLNGDNAHGFTDPFFTKGIAAYSLIGVHIAGAVGGLVLDDVDALQNGTNVLIDQTLQPRRNGVLFFGSHFFSDATNPGSYPAAPQIGVHVSDPTAIIVFKGWAATATNQCFAIDNMSAPTLPDGGTISFDGAQFGNCHALNASTGGAIDNQNQYYKINVVGGRFFTSQTSFPTIYNVAAAPTIPVQSIAYDNNFTTSSNVTFQRTSVNSGAWAVNSANSIYLRAGTGLSVQVGPGTTSSDCGLWIENGTTISGRMDASSAGCTSNLGNAAFPFNSVNATKFVSGAANGFSGTKTAGTCVLTITGGIITNVTGC